MCHLLSIDFSSLFSSSAGAGGSLAVPPASASFNSSGRSSNCGDEENDIQSDISLEEDVNELNQKVGKCYSDRISRRKACV